MRLPITRLLLASLAALAVMLMGGIFAESTSAHPDHGAGAVGFTDHFKGENVFYDYGLCEHGDEPWEISEVGTGVFHVTELANGTFWVTGTFQGSVTIRQIDSELTEDPDTGELTPIDPDYGYVPDAPVFTGHYAQWFGENGNLQNGTGTFTFNVRLRGSDGTVIHVHEVAHFTLTATGVELEFERAECR